MFIILFSILNVQLVSLSDYKYIDIQKYIQFPEKRIKKKKKKKNINSFARNFLWRETDW